MNTQELKTSVIANRLVELTTQKLFLEAQAELFDENAVSLEPENSGRASVIGLEAMQKKEHSFLNAIQQWQKIEVSKPLISNDYFSVKMTVDVILKNGQNIVVNEIIVYQTKNDKIVKELFFY
jgi:hypothetical protein